MTLHIVLVFLAFLVLSAQGLFLAKAGAESLAGTLPFLSPFGLRHHRIRATSHAWVNAHRAAAPLLLLGAGLAVLHAFGVLATGLFMGDEGAPFFHALALAGPITVTCLWLVAQNAGVAAVREAPLPQEDEGVCEGNQTDSK